MSHSAKFRSICFSALSSLCYHDLMMTKILSIQSAVTLGAVGNTMASAVMAATGHQLCRLDTIQLAAHPGHGLTAGGALDDDDFTAILEGISSLGRWQDFGAVMTGYMGSPGQVAASAAALTTFRQHYLDAPVMVDPAVGDHGQLYVAEEVAQAIAASLLPIAEVITPNAFELSYLSGHRSGDLAMAEAAARDLLTRLPNLTTIVVTGVQDGEVIRDMVVDGEGMAVFPDPDVTAALSGMPASGMPTSGMPGGGDLFAAVMMATRAQGNDWRASAARASALSRKVLTACQGGKDIDLAVVRQVVAAD